MVRSVESNTHITGLQTDPTHQRATYEFQQGPMIKTLDRYERTTNREFRTAWRGLRAGTVAMGKEDFRWTECATLDASHRAYSADVKDYRGNCVRFTVFTEVHEGDPPQEEVVKVQVSCDGDRLHFYTEVDQDLAMVKTAFDHTADVFMNKRSA